MSTLSFSQPNWYGKSGGRYIGREEGRWREEIDIDNSTLASFSSIETMQHNNLSGEGMENNAMSEIDRYLRSIEEDLPRLLANGHLTDHVRENVSCTLPETIQNGTAADYILRQAREIAPADFAREYVRHWLRMGVNVGVPQGIVAQNNGGLAFAFNPGLSTEDITDNDILQLAQEVLRPVAEAELNEGERQSDMSSLGGAASDGGILPDAGRAAAAVPEVARQQHGEAGVVQGHAGSSQGSILRGSVGTFPPAFADASVSRSPRLAPVVANADAQRDNNSRASDAGSQGENVSHMAEAGFAVLQAAAGSVGSLNPIPLRDDDGGAQVSVSGSVPPQAPRQQEEISVNAASGRTENTQEDEEETEEDKQETFDDNSGAKRRRLD